MNPDTFRFTETHEWVHLSDDTPPVATVGLSAFALEALTDLVHLELPEIGQTFDAGENACEVESVKAVSEVYAPVAGEVTEVNDALLDQLETMTDLPQEDVWLFRLQTDGEGPSGLMDGAAYKKRCADEAH